LTPALLPRRLPFVRRPELAAAVCWRWEAGDLRLCLVSTRDGARWTFPKGHREAGETLAEAAAREAREEAGVRGVVDPRWSLTYRYPSRGGADVPVTAFLLHVTEAGPPEEAFRELEWCDYRTARRLLSDGRDSLHARELVGVLDAAVREAEVEVARTRVLPAARRRLARRRLRRPVPGPDR
jgi:8-oxo-dGTP pyrophosphatase MutT (NUDIX family)